ncbi:MAG TPA: hypothetical protein VH814_07760 [Steroidobacteraceae bacterium]|jgi:hypothetical protein
MKDALTLLALFGGGVALGWWLRGRAPSIRKFVFRAVWVLFGAPVVLFVIANLVDSDSLAMIAGLSLMILVAAAVPFGLGALGGAIFAGRSRARNGESPVSVQPAASAPVVQPPPAQRPSGLSPQQRGTIIAVAGIGSAVWLMLALGFRLHDQPIPEELDQGLLPAAVVFIVTILLGARALWRWRAERLRLEQYDPIDAHKALVAAYEADPQATACCEHLAPIEMAMRRAGLRVQPSGQVGAAVNSCIDMDALRQQFSVPASVEYQEWYSRDRTGDDPPHALLFCTACESRLWLVHVREATPDTPTFPQ